MRARNIKPGFFENEVLGQLDPIISLLFAGLWCLADKAGRLEDRPVRIKAKVFPYRDGLDVNGYLTVLERHGFIQRYSAEGKQLIQVCNFHLHQNPHHTEKPSVLPANTVTCASTVDSPLKDGEYLADSLIPDSLIPDSLIRHSSPSPKNDTAVLDPKRKKKRRTRAETIQAFSDETRRVVNTLGSIWPSEGNTSDAEPTSATDTAAFCLRVSEILAKGNDPDVLIEAAKDYIHTPKKKKFAAPQFFFGVTGYGGKGDAPWVGHVGLVLTKRMNQARA